MQGPHQQLACSRSVCMGSVMHGGNFPLAQNEARKADIVLEHAKDFLDQYFTSIRRWVNRKIYVLRTVYFYQIYHISRISLVHNWCIKNRMHHMVRYLMRYVWCVIGGALGAVFGATVWCAKRVFFPILRSYESSI